jgi:transposase
VRKWVVACNAHGPSGLLDGKAPGNRPLLNPAQREALRRIIEVGPNPAVDGVVRWRLIDLAQWVYAEFRISISKQTLSRMRRTMGYRKLSARPRHHAQDPAALAAFKKTSPRVWRRSRNMRPQASRSRCGLPTRPASDRRTRSPGPFDRLRRAKRGTRPSAPRDQRTASAYIFGAICPREGKGAALVLPRCNTAAMNLHLAEIARSVAPGAHAVLLLDQAGWHLSDKLVVPPNLTLLPLPPKCPELNPVENLWQFLRDNWLSNRVFPSYRAILDHCCHAWNKLIAQPWRIISLGLRDWAHGC